MNLLLINDKSVQVTHAEEPYAAAVVAIIKMVASSATTTFGETADETNKMNNHN